MIHRELCLKLKFDHITKWYTHKPESLTANEMQKIFWDFEIQTDHLILARRPDLARINKKLKTCRLVDFAYSADHRVKIKENEKRDKYLDLDRERKEKKQWNMRITVLPIVIGALRMVPRGLKRELKDLEIGG